MPTDNKLANLIINKNLSKEQFEQAILDGSIGENELSFVDDNYDDEMSDTSDNAVQNRVIKAYIDNNIANKVDKSEADYVVESYTNETDWYRVYKSGWIEQGGVTKAQESNSYLVTLLKPYKDTNYNVSVTGKTTSKTDRGWNYAHTLTTTSFLTVQVGSGCFWQAKGQGE